MLVCKKERKGTMMPRRRRAGARLGVLLQQLQCRHARATGAVASTAAAALGDAPLAELAAAFRQRLQRLRAELGFPGALATFTLADGRLATAATGLSDVEASQPSEFASDAPLPAHSPAIAPN